MSEIRRVAILGAGAMGACLAEQFYNTPGFSTVLIASGERRARLERDGLLINGKAYFIPPADPREAGEAADLILVALKHQHLAEGVRDLGGLVGENTLFFSVMNGLESEETIGALYGMEKVLYAISLGMDAVRDGNRISFTTAGMHYFGEARGDSQSEKVRRVARAFERAGVRYKIQPDMLRWLWWKLMVNAGVNQASAVTRAPYRVFQSDPEGQALMEALMREVVALAQARGVELSEQDVQDWYPVLNRLSPQGKTSMLQDIEAGRKTEVEVFGGTVVRLGEAGGVPTPVNRAVVQIIHLLEQNL